MKILHFILILAILTVSAGLMWTTNLKESATMDELAHIPAGYSYIRYLDYRLNPEHPPLVKALAALPLLVLDLKFPTGHKSWTDDANGQWEVGKQFLYRSGNDADLIIKWSRLFPIIITLLSIIITYFLSKELLGQWWALLPSFLFGLSPTVLAHGHYVTTDVGATFGVLIASFAFIKFLLKPNKNNVIWSGLTLGLAELLKFSNALLIPFFIILVIFFLIAKKIRTPSEPIYFWRWFKNILLIFTISLTLIYAVYFLFILNYPPDKHAADAISLLHTFSPRWLAEFDISMIKNSLLRPFGQYLLGLLMVLERSAFGNTGYFLGEVSNAGWWYYFPVVFLLKEPLPSLFLIFIAIGAGVVTIIKNLKPKTYKLKTYADYLGTHLAEFALLLFIIIYWVYSIRSPLNIGIRHLLPTLPFIYILSAGALKNLFQGRKTNIFRPWATAVLIIWYLGETIYATPYFLSYFNKAAGGTFNGYHYVTDSNYDWGQDLKRLKKWVEENKIKKIAVDYFGGGDPAYYLGEKTELWWSARGNPQNEGIEWLAVSVNILQGAWGRLNTAGDLKRRPEDEYRWLKEIRTQTTNLDQFPQPDFRIGTSIFVYRLGLEL